LIFSSALQRLYILDVPFKGKVHQRCEVSGILLLEAFNQINVMLNAKLPEISGSKGLLSLF
jgi:hypothetical protein